MRADKSTSLILSQEKDIQTDQIRYHADRQADSWHAGFWAVKGTAIAHGPLRGVRRPLWFGTVLRVFWRANGHTTTSPPRKAHDDLK